MSLQTKTIKYFLKIPPTKPSPTKNMQTSHTTQYPTTLKLTTPFLSCTLDNSLSKNSTFEENSPDNSGYSTSSQKGHPSQSGGLVDTSPDEKTEEDQGKPLNWYQNLGEAIHVESRTVTSLEEPGKNDKDHLLYNAESKLFALTVLPQDSLIDDLEQGGFRQHQDFQLRVTKNPMTGKHLILVEFLCLGQYELGRFIGRLEWIIRRHKNEQGGEFIKMLPISSKIRLIHNYEFEVAEGLFLKLDPTVQMKHKVIRFPNLQKAAAGILLLDAIGYTFELNTPTKVEDKLPTKEQIRKQPKTVQYYILASIRFDEVKEFASGGSCELSHVQSRISLTLADGEKCEMRFEHDLVGDQYQTMPC